MFLSGLAVSLALLVSVSGQLVPCDERPGWLRCGDGRCVSVSELCDGREDCEAGEDESEELCSSLPCGDGVRCEKSETCLYTPHYQICSPDQRADCEDRSDEAHCSHRHFTGCFITSTLGLRISHCSHCYCSLTDRSGSDSNTNKAAVFRSSGYSVRSSNVSGTICLTRSSNLMCNGVLDCTDGADEDPAVCAGVERRRGKHLSLDSSTSEFHFDHVGGGGTAGVDQVTVAATSVTLSLIVLIMALVFIIVYRRNLQRTVSNNDFIQLEYRNSIDTESAYVSEESGTFSDYWSLENNKIVQEIGRGHYSRVYLGRNLKSSELVALKILNDEAENDLREEIEILTRLKTHPNICQILGFNMAENTLVLEYCVFGNLKDYVSKLFKTHTTDDIKKVSPFPRWCWEIADAMHFVTKMGVIHRDLALRNVLITGSNVVKLSDFGLSVFANDNETIILTNQEGQAVPYKWMALESLIEDKYSTKSDVWSFAVLVWELFMYGQDPYPDHNLDDLRLKLLEGERLEPLELASENVNRLLQDCWKEKPSERPDFDEISVIFKSIHDKDSNDYIIMKPTS